RGSMPSPACQSPVPTLDTVTRSASPASARARRVMASAMGERQMLPVHTNTRRSGSAGTDDLLQFGRVAHRPAGGLPFDGRTVSPADDRRGDAVVRGALDVVGAVADHQRPRGPSRGGGDGIDPERG